MYQITENILSVFNITTILIFSITLLTRYYSVKFTFEKLHSVEPLYDIWHDIIYIPPNKVIDLFYEFWTIIPIVVMLLLFPQHVNNFCVIHIVRHLFYSITVLPNPLFSINKTGCDMIFSGHVASSFYALYVLYEHHLIPWKILLIHQIIEVFFTLSLHRHYTIDVVISYLVLYFLMTN
jgi:hypothetical protein